MVYICDECGSQFSKGWNLDRHKKNFHKLNFVCHLCGFKTNDKQTSIIHKKHHAEEYFECNHCNQKIKNIEFLHRDDSVSNGTRYLNLYHI